LQKTSYCANDAIDVISLAVKWSSCMTDETLIISERRGPVTVVSMVYKPNNPMGPNLLTALLSERRAAHKAGARAIAVGASAKRKASP
jgi:hypothetical protein